MQRFRKRFPLLLGVCLLFFPASVSGNDFDFETLQSDIKKTIKKVRPAVVRITGRGSTFSGVIVSPEGHVLSAAHAVRPGARYQLTLPNGKRLRGRGKGSNVRTDSALILISNPGDDLPYVPMGDSSALVKDQPCVGLSFPGGQKAGTEPVIRFGHIVRSGRSRSRGGFLQSSALMEPGDSGGPLFDLNGCVVGIHSRIGTGMERNYEVPVNLFREFWNELNRESYFEEAGIPAPRLGVYGEFSEERGLEINSVVDDGIASKAGVQQGDRVVEVNGEFLKSRTVLRRVLIKARDEGDETIKISLRRDGETIGVEVNYDVEREAAPEVELPPGDHPDVPEPKGFPELRSLAQQLSDLESKLDDACVEITSEFDDDSRTITGIRIRDTKWIVTKNTDVGDNPQLEIGDEKFALKVAHRAAENDLVLLEAKEVHKVGIELPKEVVSPELGTLLLSPDADSDGRVSVLGISAFTSRKQQSRGFLGVRPSTFERNQGVRLDDVIAKGAAKRAGLEEGDVITKMNDTTVRTHRDLRTFLAKESPNDVITVTLTRGDEEMTKTIRLGAPQSTSNHAADRMKKSDRRDGFQQVYSHDADLDPDECGGPLFDLDGNFIGLNIARNSRVRCYAVPSSEIIDLVQQGKVEVSEQE